MALPEVLSRTAASFFRGRSERKTPIPRSLTLRNTFSGQEKETLTRCRSQVAFNAASRGAGRSGSGISPPGFSSRHTLTRYLTGTNKTRQTSRSAVPRIHSRTRPSIFKIVRKTETIYKLLHPKRPGQCISKLSPDPVYALTLCFRYSLRLQFPVVSRHSCVICTTISTASCRLEAIPTIMGGCAR